MPLPRITDKPYRTPRRLVVTACDEAGQDFRSRSSKWAYDVHALSSIAGVTIRKVWDQIEQGKLNPASLADVLRWLGTVNAARKAGKL